MNAETRLRVHPDVVIQTNVPEPGSCTLIRRGSRGGARQVDATFERLIRRFGEPSTLLDAVILHAESEGEEPEATLSAVWPGVLRLLAAGILVDADRPNGALEPRLVVGEKLGGARVVECVRLMEDFQVYRGILDDGREVAIKLVGSDLPRAARLLRQECELLRRLPSGLAPAVVALLDGEELALLTEWCEGLTLARWLTTPRHDALGVAVKLVRVYAELHESGVLHIDVNSKNIVVASTRVRLIDFAGSALLADADRADRLGVIGFQEPEYLRSLLEKSPAPPPSAAGEQFGVACAVFQVLTGSAPVSVPVGRQEALCALSTEPPRSFAELGVFHLGHVETVLRRALSGDPRERFGTLRAFSDALEDASLRAQPALGRRGSPGPQLLSALSPGGDWYGSLLPAVPRASVNSGAGGVALALLELAIREDDDRLLRLASDWLARARGWAGGEHGFSRPDAPLLDDVVRDGVSVLHTGLGLDWVDVLIQDAAGGERECEAAERRFVERAAVPFTNCDLTLGRAGVLAAASGLVGRGGRRVCDVFGTATSLGQLGRQIAAELGDRSAALGPISTCAPLNLGLAHGWAGLVYVMSLWSRAAGDPLPGWVEERADELITERVQRRDAWWWPWRMPGRQTLVSGWCNGSAGFVLAYCELAAASQAPEEWLRVAERAGLGLLGRSWGSGHICCGAAGAIYALARLHQATGDARWLREAARARDVALATAGSHPDPASLFKGDIGLLLIDVGDQGLRDLHFPGFGWAPAPLGPAGLRPLSTSEVS